MGRMEKSAWIHGNNGVPERKIRGALLRKCLEECGAKEYGKKLLILAYFR
jgi:hypothetical protein